MMVPSPLNFALLPAALAQAGAAWVEAGDSSLALDRYFRSARTAWSQGNAPAAGRALDAITESIAKALKEGDQVALVGFGTFLVKERAARTGRNPQTGNPIEIPAAKIPSFKAGKALKEAVN